MEGEQREEEKCLMSYKDIVKVLSFTPGIIR